MLLLFFLLSLSKRITSALAKTDKETIIKYQRIVLDDPSILMRILTSESSTIETTCLTKLFVHLKRL